MTTSDPTDQHDHFTSSMRPPVVEDHQGNGWSAVPHGALTSRERSCCEGDPFRDDDQVRLQKRSDGLIQISRFTPQGAEALAAQLLAAAEDARKDV